MSVHPTIFHITHHKAGSQWVAEILKHAAPERVVLPKLRMEHFYDDPLRPGGVYLTVYVPKPEFERVTASFQSVGRIVVVIRDWRDTLVSRYFSMRYSHVAHTEYIRRARRVLNELNIEDGILTMIGQGAYPAANAFVSFWPNIADDPDRAAARREHGLRDYAVRGNRHRAKRLRRNHLARLGNLAHRRIVCRVDRHCAARHEHQFRHQTLDSLAVPLAGTTSDRTPVNTDKLYQNWYYTKEAQELC